MSSLSLAISRLRRSPYQALAAVSIMTMTLFLAGAFFILAAGSQAVLRYFETRPQVNAYFKAEVTPTSQAVELIKSKLLATGLVDKVTYVSKEDALRIYKDLNKNDPLLLEAVTATMLPASIEVSAKKPADLKNISLSLKSEEDIEDVSFAEDVVTSLSGWIKSVRTVGSAFVGTHVSMAFSIILLIIGIRISTRREEIYLNQLVGATSWYISAPFILEGMLYGLIGAILAWGTAYLVLLYSMPFLVTFLSGIPVLPPPVWFMLEVLLGQMLLGSLIGAVGGALAVKRFQKA